MMGNWSRSCDAVASVFVSCCVATMSICDIRTTDRLIDETCFFFQSGRNRKGEKLHDDDLDELDYLKERRLENE